MNDPDITRFRIEYPATYHEGLPDDLVETLLAFHLARLGWRASELGNVLAEELGIDRLLTWLERRLRKGRQ